MTVTQTPLAIPIPKFQNESKQLSTTPSLQSVLDQKRLGNQSMRLSFSSEEYDETSSSPSSLQSLLSLDSEITSSHPLDDNSDDYLIDIDNDFFNDVSNLTPVEPLEMSSPIKLIKKPSFVSQLSKSFKSFTSSTKRQTNELVFDIQPRLTDDKLPITKIKEEEEDCELETFKVTSLSHSLTMTSLPSSTSIYRNREPRINSQFLRLYSHESSSRQKGLLPEISPEEEEMYLSNPAFYRGTNREFALLVRQRLWNCVVLPPREDALDPICPNNEYIYDNEINNDNEIKSLVFKKRQLKPWINLEDETEKNTRLSPRGVLDKGVQFTVKGWCNTRWMPTKV